MSGELGPKHWNYMGNGTDDANKDAGSALNEGVNSLINKKHNSNKDNSKKKKKKKFGIRNPRVIRLY